MQQGFDLLLLLKKARPIITSDTLLETCLGHLLLFTLAEEVCWIEKETFFATCTSQQQKAPEKVFQFHHEEQIYLLGLKETGSVDRKLKSLSSGKTYQNFVIPVKTRQKKGCYVLSFTEVFAANDHFYSFLDICQQALTDLQEIFEGQMRYAKLKVRFNGILKSLPHGIVFLDDEGYYCWVNENAAQLLAIPAGTVEPALVHTAMAEFRSRASNAVEIGIKAPLAFQGKKAKQLNWIYHEPDFKVYQVKTRKVSMSNINGALWMWADITKSYTYEQELQALNKELAAKKEQAEEIILRYRYVGQATFDAIWDWDLMQGTLFWGKNYESIFGYSIDPFNNHPIKTWKERIHPDDAVRVLNGIYRVIDSAETHWSDEYRYQKSDGSYVQVADKAVVIRNEQGTALRAVGAMQDITARKAAELKIKESEFNLRAIFESSIESFVLLDSSHRIKAFNHRAKDYIQMFWGKEPKAGDNLLEYIDSARRKKFSTYLEEVSNGRVVEYDRAYKRNGELTYWSHFTLTPVYYGSAVIGTCIAERNITDLKNYLQTIEKQNRAFIDISWTQSHLVRAPLANIMAITALLKNSPAGDEQDNLLDHLETSTHKLDVVIRKITNLSTYDHNKIGAAD